MISSKKRSGTVSRRCFPPHPHLGGNPGLEEACTFLVSTSGPIQKRTPLEATFWKNIGNVGSFVEVFLGAKRLRGFRLNRSYLLMDFKQQMSVVLMLVECLFFFCSFSGKSR